MSKKSSKLLKDFVLSNPVELSGEAAASIIKRKYGNDVQLAENYLEADYSIVWPELNTGFAFIVIKLNRQVDRFKFDANRYNDYETRNCD